MNKEQDLKKRIRTVILKSDTLHGRIFDRVVMGMILISVICIILESIEDVNEKYGSILRGLEWIFTILFTMEYILRIYVAKKPTDYIFSFFGVIDLLSILPTYLGLIIIESHFLMVVRSIRLMRIFRALKLVRFLGEADVLVDALKASRYKITVFLGFVLIATTIMGSIMYIVEGPDNGFRSIPHGMYWSVVTLTTVGYGDITPQTALGRIFSSFMMILGYGVIAVPTGIVTSELTRAGIRASNKKESTAICPACKKAGHEADAVYCKFCGAEIRS